MIEKRPNGLILFWVVYCKLIGLNMKRDKQGLRKGDKTRGRIVREAAAVFNQHGFEGASMAQLMEATGLEKGGIYRHFATKEDLAVEAFDYACESAYQARIEGLDSIPNCVDKLKRFVANFVERRPVVPGGCPILNTAIDADDGNPILRARVRRALRQWVDLLVAIVKRGVQAKEIRREVEPEKLAVLIISSLEGALMMNRLNPGGEALTIIAAHLYHHLEAEVRLRTRVPVARN